MVPASFCLLRELNKFTGRDSLEKWLAGPESGKQTFATIIFQNYTLFSKKTWKQRLSDVAHIVFVCSQNTACGRKSALSPCT